MSSATLRPRLYCPQLPDAEAIQIFLLSCEFNQLILSVAAAAVGKFSQFLEVFPLRGQLDELADGVVVTAGSPLPEC